MTDKKQTRERILIAEDDAVSRRLLETLLKKWGHEVVVAQDGLEAVRLLESRESPRMAILDWMMPGLEGVQVCQRIRQDVTRPYMYLLLLTARSQRDDLVRGLESGADDYLTKPFDSQELRARIHVGKRILDLQDNLIASREKLLYQATHDALTGISNRGVSLDALRRERFRQIREGSSFAIILLDIDHFKYVNDTYGHLAGDAVLTEAAQRIKNCIRPYDTLGRYGGEEFLVVLPTADPSGAMTVAQRIRESFEVGSMSHEGKEIAITVSLGVAVSEAANPFDAETLLNLADRALYRAKQTGRNRIDLAGPPHHTGFSPALPQEAAGRAINTEVNPSASSGKPASEAVLAREGLNDGK
jgi:two-component system cell cycle response regulator